MKARDYNSMPLNRVQSPDREKFAVRLVANEV